jgi:hypothetical protein
MENSGKWREAIVWALLAAVALELGINVVEGKTLWHRVTSLEQRVNALERKAP